MKILIEVRPDDENISQRAEVESFEIAEQVFYSMMRKWECDERQRAPLAEEEVDGIYERSQTESEAYRTAH